MKKIILLAFLILCALTVFVSCEKEFKVTGSPSPFISLSDVRALYSDSPTVLTSEDMLGATLIAGIVISDPANGNAPEGLVILQNHRRTLLRGIALAMGESARNYHAGDSLIVKIEGKTLERVHGLLQISDVKADDVTRISLDNPQHVNIESTTFTDITRWFDDYESTLVNIKSVMSVDMQLGEVFEGTKTVSDGFNTMSVTTLPTASFANEELPGYGNYTGILLRNVQDHPVMMLRSGHDYETQSLEPPQSGELYSNFPESWESIINPTNRGTGWTSKYETYITGEWHLQGCRTLSSSNFINATGTGSGNPFAVMTQGNNSATVTMNWNLPYGASRFRFECGMATASDAPPAEVRVLYSQDSGNSWEPIGSTINITTRDKYIFDEVLDINGPVRFRIEKPTSVGRISIDEISVWQN